MSALKIPRFLAPPKSGLESSPLLVLPGLAVFGPLLASLLSKKLFPVSPIFRLKRELWGWLGSLDVSLSAFMLLLKKVLPRFRVPVVSLSLLKKETVGFCYSRAKPSGLVESLKERFSVCCWFVPCLLNMGVLLAGRVSRLFNCLKLGSILLA